MSQLVYQKTAAPSLQAIPAPAGPTRRPKLADLRKRREALRPQADLATRIGRQHFDDPDHRCWPTVWRVIAESVAVNCAIRDLEHEEGIQA